MTLLRTTCLTFLLPYSFKELQRQKTPKGKYHWVTLLKELRGQLPNSYQSSPLRTTAALQIKDKISFLSITNLFPHQHGVSE